MSAIPKGSTVLMTGATGCVGSGIALEVLKAGYKIKAAVRNPEKAKLYTEAYNKRYPGGFETVLIEDNKKPGAFDDALQGCSGIIHAAGGVTSDEFDGAQLEVDTILEIARSASKVSSVKRFVFTSSTNALTRSMTEPGRLTPSSWNDEAIEVVKKPRSKMEYDMVRAFDVYSVGKVLAERALFDFVKEHKPGFVANAVNPNFNIGENIIGEPASTNNFVMALATNNEELIPFVHMILPQFLVSLVDDGLLHLAALTQEDVQNERIIAADHPFGFNDLLAVLEKLGYKDLPAPLAEKDNPKVGKTLDNTRSVELLKRYGKNGFDDLETAVRECTRTAVMSKGTSVRS